MSVDVLQLLRQQRNEMQQQIDTINAAIKLLDRGKGKSKTNGSSKRVVSPAARRKMSLAAKKRWAVRKKNSQK